MGTIVKVEMVTTTKPVTSTAARTALMDVVTFITDELMLSEAQNERLCDADSSVQLHESRWSISVGVVASDSLDEAFVVGRDALRSAIQASNVEALQCESTHWSPSLCGDADDCSLTLN